MIKTKVLLWAALATFFAGSAAVISAQTEQISYAPNDVQVLGVLNYGQTSRLLEAPPSSSYRAFVFNGNGNDRVEVTVTGDRTASIAVADPSLNMIASGEGHLSVLLPYRGPDAEGFYVIVKGQTARPARVQLRKTGGTTQPSPDATR
jgi:hypothetical protein